MGYAVSNFFVYKFYLCWDIAHRHTHIALRAYFARRKDALAVVEAMDSALWDFDAWPTAEQIDKLQSRWTSAIHPYENVDGVWYLREQNVADTTE